jgi:ferritin
MATQSLLSPQDKVMLQKAVTHELTASHMYKHLANAMQRVGYFGVQKYFLGESADELTHYQLIADFMNDRGGEADLPALMPQRAVCDDIEEAFRVAFDAEIELGKFYGDSYSASKDVVVQQFLLGFIEIQRKSVGEYLDFLATIERCESNPAALLIFDSKF